MGSADWDGFVAELRRERELLEEGRWEDAYALAEQRVRADRSLDAGSAPEGVRQQAAAELAACLAAAEVVRAEALDGIRRLARFRGGVQAAPPDAAYLDRHA